MSKITKRIVLVVSISVVLLAGLSGCGRGASAVQEPVSIREPQPTFTPTLPPGGTDPASANATPVVVSELSASDAGGADDAQADGDSSSDPAATVAPADTSEPASADTSAASSSAANDAATDGSTSAPAGTVSGRVVVNTPLVNGRAGPSTDYDVVGIVGRGEEYDIIGRNAAGDWWNVCCYEEQDFWVINELVDTVGAVDVNSVAVTEPGAPGAAPASTVASGGDLAPDTTGNESTPTESAAPAADTDSAAPAAPAPTLATTASTGEFPFDMKLQEQFDETGLVRLYVYVYNQDVQALSGYSVRVTKDGVELPVSATSFGPQAGFTWPVAEPRQRFQNLEVEFPDEDPAGTWTVQLIDESGTAVGPTATFEMTANDPQQELYVRYEQL